MSALAAVAAATPTERIAALDKDQYTFLVRLGAAQAAVYDEAYRLLKLDDELGKLISGLVEAANGSLSGDAWWEKFYDDVRAAEFDLVTVPWEL
jgi:hypothetical protein